jgi:aryl sulfotransferase
MSGLIWLASYPKSGNTWLRVFLANLRSESEVPAEINSLHTAQFSARELWDRAIGWQTAELSPTEVDSLRLPVQRMLAETSPEVPIKTHEVFADPRDGRARFCPHATRCVLYVVRDPRDIAISLAHHRGDGIEAAIAFINDSRAMLNGPTSGAHMAQLLCDWSTHVKSWADATGLNVCVLRYEDMLRDPEVAFGRAARAAGISVDTARITRAMAHSSFARLQEQEAKNGFVERADGRVFFRMGRAGAWRDALTARQSTAIVERHAEVMKRFGYLDDRGAR